MTEPLRHSYSSISQFEKCPKRFWHQRIIKDVVDKGGEASIYGDRVHKALELRLKEGTELPKDIAKHEPICLAVEAMKMHNATLSLEQELVLDKELNPTTWWADEAWMRSKLDVMILDGDKGVSLDWKSGKRRPDFFQLEVTVVQMFVHYPELTKINTAFVWLQNNEMDSEIYTRAKDFEQLKAKLIKKTERIEEAVIEDVWPAKPGPLCNYCPAKNICAYAELNSRRRW